MSEVRDPATAEAIDGLVAAVDALVEAGVAPNDAADARVLIDEVEAVARRVRSVQVTLVDEIDRSGAHRVDGHASAKVMVRHVARLSNAEACRRASSAKALRDLPVVAEAFAAGRIGACQVERIARAHANPRVRAQVEANDEAFATEAETDDYRDFDRKVTAWVDLVDADGARDRDQRSHENRDVKLGQDYDGSWRLTGGFGSLQGVELHAIFAAFLEAETLADWEKARATHGEAATEAHLPRTEGQRRADALFEVFQRAAALHASSVGGSQIVTDIVIDHATFERVAAELAGIDTSAVDAALSPFPSPSYRCSTLDGRPVEATAAVAHALVGHVRRVVIGADSVVIDLGRRRRLFTGPAALAVKLARETCYWPGCQVPVTRCQCDHLTPWATRAHGSAGGGCTCPGNGGPGCGKHNRFKHRHDFRVRRDPDGTVHVHRPDGTRVD